MGIGEDKWFEIRFDGDDHDEQSNVFITAFKQVLSEHSFLGRRKPQLWGARSEFLSVKFTKLWMNEAAKHIAEKVGEFDFSVSVAPKAENTRVV